MRGPPELPELIAASVWMSVISVSLIEMFLLRPDIIPPVTVFIRSNPRGLPIAVTVSPRRSESLSPNSAAVSPFASIFRTARSKSTS